jgi:hypothetical protein
VERARCGSSRQGILIAYRELAEATVAALHRRRAQRHDLQIGRSSQRGNLAVDCRIECCRRAANRFSRREIRGSRVRTSLTDREGTPDFRQRVWRVWPSARGSAPGRNPQSWRESSRR